MSQSSSARGLPEPCPAHCLWPLPAECVGRHHSSHAATPELGTASEPPPAAVGVPSRPPSTRARRRLRARAPWPRGKKILWRRYANASACAYRLPIAAAWTSSQSSARPCPTQALGSVARSRVVAMSLTQRLQAQAHRLIKRVLPIGVGPRLLARPSASLRPRAVQPGRCLARPKN